jgi:microcystin-dependent protein
MAIKKFQDLQVEHPQRYEVTDNAGTENLKTIKFSPGKVYQEGTKETAVIFNNIQKNGLYTVIGTRVIEGTEEIYDVELEGLEEFGIFDINLQLVANAKNTTNSPKLRILSEKYSFANNNGTISIGDIVANNIYIVKINTVKKTAFLMESDKLQKGTYPGKASDLKSEIDKKASKTTLGRIIVGDNLTVDSNGRMSGNPAVDISGKLDKGTYSGNAGDLKAEIDGKFSKSGGGLSGSISIRNDTNPVVNFDTATGSYQGFVGRQPDSIILYNNISKKYISLGDDGSGVFHATNLNTTSKEVIGAINENYEKFKNFCPFPVNSLFLTLDNSNPATLFLGTTWQKQEGRFLIGSSSSYAIGSTGGSATITLTEANMPRHRHQVDSTTATIPAHTHTINTGTNDYRRNDGRITWGGTGDFRGDYSTNSAGGGSTGAIAPYTNYVGSGTAFNNMPPYLVVNIWKRIS